MQLPTSAGLPNNATNSRKGATDLLQMLEMSTGRLRVSETDPHTDARWASFVTGHPNGSIYHHPAWLAALEKEYGQKGVYLQCVDAAGQVRAILPLHYTQGLPFKLGGALTGPRLASLPRTPIAGPLSVDKHATTALLAEAVRRVTQKPGTRLQIKLQAPELDGLVNGVVGRPWRLSYVVDLTPGPDGSFRIVDSGDRYAIKKAINKAKRLGVGVREAGTERDLREWYQLHLETMRRNSIPARPYRFFASLWEILRSQGVMNLLVAEQREGGRARMLAGVIFLRLGTTVSAAFNGSRFSALALRPNDILYWTAINDACRAGYKHFDFGEVPEGNTELARYKMKWGAAPVRLYRYYYPAPPEAADNSYESASFLEAVRTKVWQRLPLQVTQWLGDRIYSYL